MASADFTRRTLLAAGLWLAAAACASAPDVPAREAAPLHLVVLHTNDVHGQLLPVKLRGEDGVERLAGGLQRVAARVEEVRAELGPDDALVLVDAGDWFQGTPEGRIDEGEAFVRLMRDVGYDAMAVGNHEFDYGVAHLAEMLQHARPPAVLANVFEPSTGERVAWAEPYRLVERGGLSIAFVGLVTPETPDITPPDTRALEFREPAAALAEVLEELEGRADLVIPLTHLGHEHEIELARAFQDLPLIVGGHSHTRVPAGRLEGRTLVVQAGSKAQELGRVDLWIDRAGGEVLPGATATLLDLSESGALDPKLAAACDELAARTDASMDAVVWRLAAPLERRSGVLSSSTAGNLIADVFRERAGADVGLHNKGGIRATLAAGDVTRRELFELLPFDNTLVVLELSGAELTELVRRAVESREHSGIEVSGLLIHVEEPGAATSRLLGLTVGGEPLDPERSYRVATNSFLARGGDRYIDPDWSDATLDTGLLMRDVLEDALRERGALAPSTQERFAGASAAVAPASER